MLLFIWTKSIYHFHLFIVEFENIRILIKGHVQFLFIRIVELFNASIVEKIILLFQFLKSHLKLRVLFFFFEVKNFSNNILKKHWISNSIFFLDFYFVEHILQPNQIEGPFLKRKINGFNHQGKEVLHLALSMRKLFKLCFCLF